MLKVVLIMLSAHAVVSTSGLQSRVRPLRNLIGVVNAPERFVYVVTIARASLPYSRRICTGSLIAINWVLTAAHCFREAEIHEIAIRNYRIIYNETQEAKVLQGVVHREYKETSNEVKHDIALLAITAVKDVTLGKLSPADYSDIIGRFGRYLGSWGSYTNADHVNNSRHLRYKHTTDHDQLRPLQIGEAVVVTCKIEGFTESLWVCVKALCAKYREDSQRGDSGGPLILDGKIIAVAHGCANDHTYVFTVVSPYLDWITNTISNKINSKEAKMGVPRITYFVDDSTSSDQSEAEEEQPVHSLTSHEP